ncbi:vitamin B6 photo-protection and homoeostasis-domain-containing protein [Gautieria morchelliformis]|nr:vitamin B6 photo-protection and homoeostasis-domain-containing protein [Gautieria morchelliformis]
MSRREELVIEEDEAGRVCHRYICSESSVDILDETSWSKLDHGLYKNITKTLSNIFMPAGYPNSVSSDYFEYQLYDSFQAFSSTIAGLLASRAVLEGVGVGDASASATHALLLTITQDAVSRLATILFAWRIGTALEPEAKRYRLLADIFNDGAMILDCLSPALPKHVRLFSLCVSGSLRALCGVAAGGAKAALSVHFARANNIGDLNAKDSSQETVIGLLGMLAGSFVVSRVTTQAATWSLLLLLLAVHLSTNYLAVRAIAMSSLNRQRANIVYSHFRATSKVQSPAQVAKMERIFAPGSSLYGSGRVRLGFCEIGVRINRLLRMRSTNGLQWTQHIMQTFAGEKYILWFSTPAQGPSANQVYSICLEKGSAASDHLKAWVHAIELAHTVSETGPLQVHSDGALKLLEQTHRVVNDTFPTLLQELTQAGWDVEKPALLTRPNFMISRTVWPGNAEEKKLK